MSLITIASVGTLTASAASVSPNTDTQIDELIMPAGYRYFTNSTNVSAEWIQGFSDVHWDVTVVDSQTVRLTVTTNLDASATVTAEIYCYLIDPAKYWGMESVSVLRRWPSV